MFVLPSNSIYPSSGATSAGDGGLAAVTHQHLVSVANSMRAVGDPNAAALATTFTGLPATAAGGAAGAHSNANTAIMLNALTAAAAAGGLLVNAGNMPLIPAAALPLHKPDLKLGTAALTSLPNMAQVKATNNQKQDTSKHYHVFVGDLSPEVENHKLREAFSMFGIVTECRIIKDMHTQKPKGYGFVAYAHREEAEEAINKMSGQILGSRPIRTNWAVRRPLQAAAADHRPLNYDEVNAASSVSNCTVYVGGITKGLSEELLKRHFGEFGAILEIRLFKEKGYAFVRFDNHEAATNAIITMHGKEVGGQPCKCSWGKESSENSLMKDQLSPSLLNLYQCYANSNSLSLAAAAAAAAAASAAPNGHPGASLVHHHYATAAPASLNPYLHPAALTFNASSLTSPNSAAMFMMPLNAAAPHPHHAAFHREVEEWKLCTL